MTSLQTAIQSYLALICRIYKTVHFLTETAAPRCSVKMVFLEISQNLQENTCTS